ncbi:histidine kinase [Arcicella aurantiaca]|uniref:Histidine kinase n=1 Tax=Arcicella aurantiaca TaxID=591202 RepID=A0A316E713_9BACT|nr:histidine kinase [Arcicella aurantiaca]PWK26201.1 histidine kinase [Arcicella aurantiaca]
MTKTLPKYQTIFLHLAFWAFVLALPFLLKYSTPPTGIHKKTVIQSFTMTEFFTIFALINVPFFYLNSEILIPKILHKKGILVYLISAIGLIVGVFFLHTLIKDIFFPGQFIPRTGSSFQLLFFLAISAAYRIMSDNLQYEQEQKEQETEKLKSELSFLRSQISPHFMFNVLNSIVSLSRRKPEKVEPVVVKLSDLMRYMLYESDDAKVTLQREAQYLRAYIELQQLRFGDDIEINFNADNLNGNKTIEPMLLIPFVENAFKHGVGMIINPTIDIDLHTTDSKITFEVKNKVNRQYKEEKDGASGIGLANVKRRLELLYPDNHRLTIKDEDQFYGIYLEIS